LTDLTPRDQELKKTGPCLKQSPVSRGHLTPWRFFPAELGFFNMYDLPAGRAACQHLIDPLIGFQSVLFAAPGTADKGILSGFDLRGNFSFFFPASAKKKQER
jgi:hypothetical protein